MTQLRIEFGESNSAELSLSLQNRRLEHVYSFAVSTPPPPPPYSSHVFYTYVHVVSTVQVKVVILVTSALKRGSSSTPKD